MATNDDEKQNCRRWFVHQKKTDCDRNFRVPILSFVLYRECYSFDMYKVSSSSNRLEAFFLLFHHIIIFFGSNEISLSENQPLIPIMGNNYGFLRDVF